MDSESVLYQFCSEGNIEDLDALMRNQEFSDAQLEQALITSVSKCRTTSEHIQCIELLLSKTASANYKTSNGTSLLMTAAQLGQIQLVNLLLDRNAWISDVDYKNRTPLFYAVNSPADDGDVVQCFLRAGANVTHTDCKQRTALHHAAKKGLIQSMRVLIEAKANTGARDQGGKIPIDLAQEAGHDSWVDFLKALAQESKEKQSRKIQIPDAAPPKKITIPDSVPSNVRITPDKVLPNKQRSGSTGQKKISIPESSQPKKITVPDAPVVPPKNRIQVPDAPQIPIPPKAKIVIPETPPELERPPPIPQPVVQSKPVSVPPAPAKKISIPEVTSAPPQPQDQEARKTQCSQCQRPLIRREEYILHKLGEMIVLWADCYESRESPKVKVNKEPVRQPTQPRQEENEKLIKTLQETFEVEKTKTSDLEARLRAVKAAISEKERALEEEGGPYKVRTRTSSILFMEDRNPRPKSQIVGTIDKEIQEFVKEIDNWQDRSRAVFDEIVTELRRVIQEKRPSAEINYYGSHRMGINLPHSNLELVITDNPSNLSMLEQLNIYYAIFHELSFVRDIRLDNIRQQLSMIALYSELEFGVIVTIHEQYHHSVQRFNLISTYLKEYLPLRPLILIFEHMFLTYFSSQVFITELDSYSIILMIVCSLQIRATSPQLTVGEIFEQTLKYYAFDYNYFEDILNPTVQDSNTPIIQQNYKASWMLHITDPLDRTKNVVPTSYGTQFNNSYNINVIFRWVYEALWRECECDKGIISKALQDTKALILNSEKQSF